MKREDLPSSEVLASIGLAAAGVVAGVVARAVSLGGKVVAAGLETVERALRPRDDETPPPTAPSPVTRLRHGQDTTDAEAAPWADGVDALPNEAEFEAPFEPADGLTRPARPARRVPRRSSAGAARTAPAPRPAKRATARSIPPPLRPVRNGPAVGAAEPEGAVEPEGAADPEGAETEEARPSGAAPSPDATAPAAKKTARKTPARAHQTAAAKAAAAKKTPAAQKATAAKSATKTAAAKRTTKKTVAGDAAAPATKATSARRRTAKKTAETAPVTTPPAEPGPQSGGARHDDVRSVP